MATHEKLNDALEAFNARLLAVDPADMRRIEQLKVTLGEMLPSFERGSPSAELLTLGLAALESIGRGGTAAPDAALQTVAASVATAIGCLGSCGEPDRLALEKARDSLRAIVNSAEGRSADGFRSTIAAAAGDRMTLPGAASVEWDPDLVREFIAESNDRIAAAESSLLSLETTPGDAEQINTVLRAFHTIKGAAGFLGLDIIQNLAHLVESLLIQAREGKIQIVGRRADLALKSCDALKWMLQGLKAIQPGGQISRPEGFEALCEALAAAVGETEGSATESSAASSTGPQALPEPEAPAASDKASAARPDSDSDSSVRVGTRRLDDLINMVGELVIAQSIVAQNPLVARSAHPDLSRSVSQAGKIVRELQDLTMSLRMVPLKATFGKMVRLVRDLSQKSGKSVQLHTSGEETEIDRNMVETLSDPLVHMIRNAVDHGIEPADERRGAGKSETGVIRLHAYHSAGNVVIELQDDGRGLDCGKILQKAVGQGLVKDGQELPEADVYSLIFHPGLSTAQRVTDVSGRGVGMDVVKRSIESLRGKIEIQSRPGAGTTFTLRLPLTMAIADAMLVKVGTERYLLPTSAIQRSFRPEASAVSTVTGRGEMATLRGELLPVFRLHRLFDVPGAVANPSQGLLIVIEGDGKRCALMVDELLGQQQVVIKSLGETFAGVPGVSGGAILGDGRIGLILDATGLVQLAHRRKAAA